MEKSYFEYVDSDGMPLSEDFLYGTREQAEAFTRMMHGFDETIKCVLVDPETTDKTQKTILDNVRFHCNKEDGISRFEVSYENNFLIAGFQDSVSGSMVVEADEAAPQFELKIEDFILFPDFEYYAVCELCGGEGGYDGSEVPYETKMVPCSCPNTIFVYEP